MEDNAISPLDGDREEGVGSCSTAQNGQSPWVRWSDLEPTLKSSSRRGNQNRSGRKRAAGMEAPLSKKKHEEE